MKIYFLPFMLVFVSFYAVAQVPKSFSYQAIIRSFGGQEITNQLVGIQISILQNSIPVYGEQFCDK